MKFWNFSFLTNFSQNSETSFEVSEFWRARISSGIFSCAILAIQNYIKRNYMKNFFLFENTQVEKLMKLPKNPKHITTNSCNQLLFFTSWVNVNNNISKHYKLFYDLALFLLMKHCLQTNFLFFFRPSSPRIQSFSHATWSGIESLNSSSDF